jgi:hypothetical protein
VSQQQPAGELDRARQLPDGRVLQLAVPFPTRAARQRARREAAHRVNGGELTTDGRLLLPNALWAPPERPRAVLRRQLVCRLERLGLHRTLLKLDGLVVAFKDLAVREAVTPGDDAARAAARARHGSTLLENSGLPCCAPRGGGLQARRGHTPLGPRLGNGGEAQPRPQPKLGALAGSEAARAAQALASKLYGLGKERRVPGKGELERLDAEVALRAADMSSKSLALTLWAYARLRRAPANTSRAQLDAAVGIRAGELDAQGLANSLWAYATMGRPPAAALQSRIDEHVARTLGEFKAQNLANSLWAYAKLGRPPATALQARIDEHVLDRLPQDWMLARDRHLQEKQHWFAACLWLPWHAG